MGLGNGVLHLIRRNPELFYSPYSHRAGCQLAVECLFKGGVQGFPPEFVKQLLLRKSGNDLPEFILCISPEGLSADVAL